MSNCLVSYLSGKNGCSEFGTNEMIRAYGELHTDVTLERREEHNKSNAFEDEKPLLNTLQKQLNDL